MLLIIRAFVAPVHECADNGMSIGLDWLGRPDKTVQKLPAHSNAGQRTGSDQGGMNLTHRAFYAAKRLRIALMTAGAPSDLKLLFGCQPTLLPSQDWGQGTM